MANIKRNKGIKGPTIAICAVATVALVGVGFAAWVISGSSSVSTTGNIQVDVVNDTSYPIVLNGWEDGKDSIVFGVPSTSQESSIGETHASWLSITNTGDSDEVENLSVTLNFRVYNVAVNDDLSQILSVDFGLTSGNSPNDYNALESYKKGYVSGLPNEEDGTLTLLYKAGGESGSYTEISSESASLSETDIIASTDPNNPGYYVACQATATFSWGPAFNYMNPYEFSYYVEQYESSGTTDGSVITSDYLGGSDSYTAITSQLLFSQALQQLETDFYYEGSGISFTLTITASANS